MMDKLSVAGLVLGLSSVIVGQILEGGAVTALWQGAALFIVLGGTVGAVMLQSPFKVFVSSLKIARWVFIPPPLPMQEMVYQIAEWGIRARKDGTLALEVYTDEVSDPFMKKGLQLLIDGNSAEKIREVLEVDIHTYEQLRWQSARVWEAAGGYAPTIGILGAVLGLIHVMGNLADPTKLGAGIAVAFIATIYGVGLANLVFLPIANKLKALITQQVEMREMLVDGLEAIARGENPRFIENKLQGYIS